jgi:uncharacterized damage-inducible protein DinB
MLLRMPDTIYDGSMPTSLLTDAFAHHIWATETVIDACTALSSEQLATPAPGTFGPIVDTLRHLVSSDSWYLSFFRPGTEQIDERAETALADLRSIIARNGTAWTDVLADRIDPDADMPEIGDTGWEFHAPAGVRLAQVVQHGNDHRSQVCTALTSLGVEPPDIAVWAFAEATGRSRSVPEPAG